MHAVGLQLSASVTIDKIRTGRKVGR